MIEHERAKPTAVPDLPEGGGDGGFGAYRDPGRHGLVRRYLATWRHVTALVIGGTGSYLRGLPARERRRPLRLLLRATVALLSLPLNRELKRAPFPVQLRRRFEMLGTTYIKLGQSLSLREDIFPTDITDELKGLFDRLPAIPYEEFLELVERELRQPADKVFGHIRKAPLASASIGQTHLATTHGGELVVLKLVKPGVRATLRRDAIILRGLGAVLQLFFPRLQPRRVLRDFCRHTLREADMRLEADNAETFASAFRAQDEIVFPRILRDFTTQNLLCMEYIDGIKPTDPRAKLLDSAARERLVDLGAEAVIGMLFRDGFFHADLHPGNLLILGGPRLAFIDLGTVGRFDADTKRTFLYYYYSLVTGDSESAANYLAALAEVTSKSDPIAFRRDVEDVCRQFLQRIRLGRGSLAQLIMESIARAARHGMYFPLDMVLMVKAILTFESVGRMLVEDFDVAAVSRRHVQKLMLARFAPLRLAQDSLTALPEVMDALAKTPRLVTEALQLVEQAARRPAENPFEGVRATLYGGFCLVAAAILAAFGGPWPAWAALLAIGLLLPLRRGGR